MKLLHKLALVCCVATLAAAPAICLAADDSAQSQSSKKKTVDINNATSEELQTLKGIDSDTASKIIAGRPYASPTQLVSKGIITKEVFNDIRYQLTAKAPADDGGKNSNKNKNKNNNNRGKSSGGKGGGKRK